MYKIIHPSFQHKCKDLEKFIIKFEDKGSYFSNGARNKIKLFDLDGFVVNIKSFKKPIFFNQIIYEYFRKSKAKRSYEFANILLKNGIGTPKPIAFFENFDWLGLKDSYYISEHLEADLTYRELINVPDYPNYDTILSQFTKFTFDIHEKGIEFLDHSPGNTLIKKGIDNQFQFYLVDLNRMKFHHKMDFDTRMKNFSRLTPKKEMIAMMSSEYAKYYLDKSEDEIFEKMWMETCRFRDSFERKKRIKNKLNF